MRHALFCFVYLTLQGCAPTLQERQAALDSTCRGYGFAPGTDAYRNCWMTVDQAQRTRAAGGGMCTVSGQTVICN